MQKFMHAKCDIKVGREIVGSNGWGNPIEREVWRCRDHNLVEMCHCGWEVGYHGGAFIPFNKDKIKNNCIGCDNKIKNSLTYYKRYGNFCLSCLRLVNDIIKRKTKAGRTLMSVEEFSKQREGYIVH